MPDQKFAPRVASRDLQDTLIAVVIGTFQTAVLFGLPALATYLGSGSIGSGSGPATSWSASFRAAARDAASFEAAVADRLGKTGG